MAVGFVLVTTSPNRERDVYDALVRLPAIKELHPLFGEFDLIAKLTAPGFDEMGHVIVTQIRSIEGVVDTKTLTGTRL